MVQLQAKTRATSGKGTARKLRRQGWIPGVLYGSAIEENTLLQLPLHEFEQKVGVSGIGRLVELGIGRERQTVLLKEVSSDPVSGSPIHVDFQLVALDEETHTRVPLWVRGEEDRAPDHGILSQQLREVEVACLPTQIPESIEVDVSKLVIGDALTVADLSVPEGVRILDDPQATIVSIVAPRLAAVESETSDAEADGDEAGAAASGEEDAGEAESAS